MLLMLVGIIGLSSCGGFVMDEALEIESIDYELMEDGRTKVTISYTDSLSDPAIFYIPKGENGADGVNGNGIKKITSRMSEDLKNTIIRIEFTSDTMAPVEVMVANGVSVEQITSSFDEASGNTSLIIKYSNGDESDPIIIPKGEKGDNGIGIMKYEAILNDDGSQKLIFTYTDGNTSICEIPAPQKGDAGKDGNYIAAITAYEDDEKYYITFVFNEGEPKILEFSRPEKPNTWLSGNDVPQNYLGKEGDYYFDTLHKAIYTKTQGNWVVVVDLDDNDESYVVAFNLNDNDGGVEAKLPDGARSQYFVGRGKYFATENYIVPLPTREGYSFGGWYTTKTPNINNGAFTDLTPVFANLTLYAKWIKE